MFLADDETKSIIMIGEIGGSAEEDAAQFLKDEAKRGRKKPMAGFIAGRTAPQGPHHGPRRRHRFGRQGRRGGQDRGDGIGGHQGRWKRHQYGGARGVREIVYGMAHRGRLNVLANVMAKGFRVIFHEFSGGTANPEDVGGSGDVKYHLGTSTDREFDGIKVHMSLVPNPSHLETVDPVVLGKVRAQQVFRDDLDKHEQVLPVLIHGDAAFAGQGIVWECFGFSGVKGYNTGGCIHFHHQQSDRLHHQPAIFARLALSFGCGEGRPGTDPACEWRRSRSGDLRLQAGNRLSPDLPPRYRDRHVVLSPFRAQ
jgi:hypothetical protein